MTVRAAQPTNDRDRPTPGSTERAFGGDQLMRLPIDDQSDLTAIAALVPDVLTMAGSDSTSSAFSVAGQLTTANNVTVANQPSSFTRTLTPRLRNGGTINAALYAGDG